MQHGSWLCSIFMPTSSKRQAVCFHAQKLTHCFGILFEWWDFFGMVSQQYIKYLILFFKFLDRYNQPLFKINYLMFYSSQCGQTLQPSRKSAFSMVAGSLVGFPKDRKAFGEICWRWLTSSSTCSYNGCYFAMPFSRRKLGELKCFVYQLHNGTWKLMCHAWGAQFLRRCNLLGTRTTCWSFLLRPLPQSWIASSKGLLIHHHIWGD